MKGVSKERRKERVLTMKRLMESMKKMIEKMVMAYVNCMNAYGDALFKSVPGAQA